VPGNAGVRTLGMRTWSRELCGQLATGPAGRHGMFLCRVLVRNVKGPRHETGAVATSPRRAPDDNGKPQRMIQ
jgi:hypothetical protein